MNPGRKWLPPELTEEIALFTSVIKWFILSILTGLGVGGAATGFLIALDDAISYTGQFPFYFLLLPVGMFLSSLMVRYLAPEAVGHGTEKVIEAVHRRAGKISLPVVPVKFLATIVTLSTGGSVGKEGPCAQIGGGVASLFADILRFDDRDRRKLVICGISAGFSTVFGTPIAGAIFGIEVLYVGNIFYDALFPSFVSGVVAYQMAQWLGLKYLHMPGAFEAVFAGSFVVEAAMAGIFFGVVSLVFVETMEGLYRLSIRANLWPPLKAFLAGVAIAVAAIVFGREFLGLGLPVIKGTLEGNPAPWYYFILKMLFTSATLAFGGSGGIVTPIFFVGATAGSLFAVITGSDPATFAAIGMVSVLAGAANTPISASIMAIEMFGTKIGPYAAVVCIISYLITGHRSVYPSQMIVRTKSPTVLVETGKLLEEIERVEITPRKGTLFDLMLRCIDRAMAWLQRAREFINRKRSEK
jgi:H+/Cl- antiporter ClcA